MGMAATKLVNSTTARSIVLVDGRERRRRKRLATPPMYTSVKLRVLSQQLPPMEGHVVDLSETGMAIEVDYKIKVGSAITVEFMVSGLGRMRTDSWPTFAAAAEVVRHDNVEDFPKGPYRTALRFIRLPSIIQAQISRYIMANPVTQS